MWVFLCPGWEQILSSCAVTTCSEFQDGFKLDKNFSASLTLSATVPSAGFTLYVQYHSSSNNRKINTVHLFIDSCCYLFGSVVCVCHCCNAEIKAKISFLFEFKSWSCLFIAEGEFLQCKTVLLFDLISVCYCVYLWLWQIRPIKWVYQSTNICLDLLLIKTHLTLSRV